MRKILVPVAAIVLAFAACTKEGANESGPSNPGGTDSTSTPGNGVNQDSVVTYKDLMFGLQAGDDVYGHVFSSKTGLVYPDGNIPDSVGQYIDVLFHYLGFNMYFSSANVMDGGQTVPHATTTIFKNNVLAGDPVTAENFDTIEHASTLKKLVFVDDNSAVVTDSIPTVVYFKNSWNKTGVIKLKSVSEDHITVDVKVMY